MEQVRMSVAIVMPEIGFDEVPMSPVILDDTVTKKNPNTMVRIAASTLPRVGSPGATTRNTPRRRVPRRTALIGISRSVRAIVFPRPAPKSLTLSRNDDTIVGIVRHNVMIPAASTAPAPV